MSSTEELFARYGPAYRLFATTAALASSIAVILSATIVNVAVPDVMGAFGIDAVQAQWVSTGYLAAMTATMLLSDWTDRSFGTRGAVIGALSLFILGSVIGGAAPNEVVLTIGRVFQGASAGITQPLSMTIMFRVFPPEKRGSAMGYFGIGVVLAPALGPWVGGILIDSFSWRYVFYMGIPFAALGIGLAWLFLPTRRDSGPRPKFDWIGFALLTLFLLTLLNALTNGPRFGWRSDPILLQLSVAAVAAIAFLGWERIALRPMLDLRLFLVPAYSAAALISFIMGVGIFGSIYLLPLFVQTIQGLTPTEAGTMLMPAGFALAIAFPISGRISDRFAPGFIIGAGMVVFAYSSYLTAGCDVNTGFWALALFTVLSRIGLGLVFPALSASSLRVLPPAMVGQGSGAMNFTRQLGGAFGVNLLAVFYAERTAYHAAAIAATQTPGNSSTLLLLDKIGEITNRIGMPLHEQLPAGLVYLGRVVYQQASTLAFQDGFMVTAIVFACALLPTWLLDRASRKVVRPQLRPA